MCVLFIGQDKEGNGIDLSQGFVVHSMAMAQQQQQQQQQQHAQQQQPRLLAPCTGAASSNGAATTSSGGATNNSGGNTVHNLNIAGQSVLISTPSIGGGGSGGCAAGNGSLGIDFAPTALHVSRMNGVGSKAPATSAKDAASADSAVEAMNISPRPDNMDE